MNNKFLILTYFIFLVATSSLTARVQGIDVSGEWRGTYNLLGKSYAMGMKLKQEGTTVSGTTYSISENPEEVFEYTLEGKVKGEKIVLTGIEFTKKTKLSCMAKYTLKLVNAGNQMIMDGKWGPNLKSGGCLPGAFGKVNVQKVQSSISAVPVADRTPNQNENDNNDIYTKEMIKGLKDRKFHALIIGIDNYKDRSVTSLDNPTSDAKELMGILSKKYSFAKENITFLQNPGRMEILDEFERLSNSLGEKDNLLVFYAGHGYWDEKLEQGYWLPSDASMTSKAQWISNATIRDYIRGINSKHTLLIADACFSGGLLKSRGVGKAMINLYNMPSRKAITSGTLTTVPDKSVFIKYLIKYLSQNTETLISADQIFYKIKVSVMNNSPSSQVPQYGPIHQANDEGGEFVFFKSEQ
ncbi:MAG: caspase family protein [Bacteroidota bacterium]